MSSEVRNDFDAKYDDRVRKIREAAADVIRQLDQLRSAGTMSREALDAEVAHISQEKLHPHGCDLVVHRTDDGVSRFLIRVQSTGRGYDLIKSFFHRDDGLIPRAEA
jgi:hypothetical protein